MFHSFPAVLDSEQRKEGCRPKVLSWTNRKRWVGIRGGGSPNLRTVRVSSEHGTDRAFDTDMSATIAGSSETFLLVSNECLVAAVERVLNLLHHSPYSARRTRDIPSLGPGLLFLRTERPEVDDALPSIALRPISARHGLNPSKYW